MDQNLQQMLQAAAGDPMLLMHFPSVKLAKAWEGLLGFENLDLVEPYGRVAEQSQMQRRQNAAQTQVETEDLDDLGAGDEDASAPQPTPNIRQG